MGKSLGNVLEPGPLVRAYGADAVRLFFIKEVPFGQVRAPALRARGAALHHGTAEAREQWAVRAACPARARTAELHSEWCLCQQRVCMALHADMHAHVLRMYAPHLCLL